VLKKTFVNKYSFPNSSCKDRYIFKSYKHRTWVFF